MNDTEGHVDILVCMAGTGGTGFSTASYLRSRNPNLQVVLVQPHPDSRLTPEHPDAQIICTGRNDKNTMMRLNSEKIAWDFMKVLFFYEF